MNLGEIPELLRKTVEPMMADKIRSNIQRLLREEKKVERKVERHPQQVKHAPKKLPTTVPRKPRVSMSGPPTINSLPRLKPKIEMKPGPVHNSVRVSVADYLGPLHTPEGDSPTRGSVILNTIFSPARLDGSKITTIAMMYERYVVNSLKFHYFSSTPTTVGGAMIMAFDKDPSDSIAGGEAGIRHAMGLSSMTQFAPWEHASLAVQKENAQTFYFTSPASTGQEPERLEYTGELIVVISSPGTLADDATLGDIWFEADVTFYDPTWEPTDVSAIVSNDPGVTTNPLDFTVYEGFAHSSAQSGIVIESNVTFIPDGRIVNMTQDAVGFIVPPGVYKVTDTLTSLSSTNITLETLIALPLIDGKVVPNAAAIEIAFTHDLKSTNTSATQLNWFSNFTVRIPDSFTDADGGDGTYGYWVTHAAASWYLTSSLTGSVAGTYGGRTITITRETGFSRSPVGSGLKRHRIRHFNTKRATPASTSGQTKPPTCASGKGEVVESGCQLRKHYCCSACENLQNGSDSQQSGLSVPP
jgi:hypothetical protein